MAQITQELNSSSRSTEVGLAITRGGEITLDDYIGETFKWLHVEVGGNVIVEGVDGSSNIIPFYGILSGSWIPVVGKRVLTSAVINGNPQSTTATGITWYGGA